MFYPRFHPTTLNSKFKVFSNKGWWYVYRIPSNASNALFPSFDGNVEILRFRPGLPSH